MLEGIARDSMTKQETKSLRRDGYLIANIYGKGLENINAAFKMNEFIRALKAKETLAFDVSVSGTTFKVVVQEYQKCPITSDLLHVDLMVAQPGVKTTYKVPVKSVGTPIGLKNKGLFVFHKKRVPVKTTIENLPENFTLNVDALDTGHNILVRDLELPEGVECFLDPRVPIVGVIKAK
ncbi:50S ribosomal protein L25/general stress protein Ctc [Malaciobacter molluscorum LMG 25693]|uniref:Large ribosomal subunit protein bL25 n=1 Tax=Malaciobacter molluscorum LMG 25693 TaxID=870501 RepID=A0A2G1DFT9_9BACT|nr:50S ribosomal protein L25/general stress protein Ctc [Malaciobacter molluscorum]AXX91740.1 50S ribosomal protein L25 [Malaciobacter molluscorum LMG 25693]PHO17372.1 50S ribosomal protein L25/general stress protein Ctc [Malaciobacter molluscorum LMG 25693]RXJ92800.1 50S ribosomal protein L25/general stress protein Ctc [Malaciobacter molluscorum]